MNTKLANLLFEENNIKNITKVFEESNFLIKENSTPAEDMFSMEKLKTISADELSELIVKIYDMYKENAGKPNTNTRLEFINNNKEFFINSTNNFIRDNESWIQSQNESNLQEILKSSEDSVFASIYACIITDYLLDRVTSSNENFELVEFLSFQEERSDIFKGFLRKENESFSPAERDEIEKQKLLKFNLNQSNSKDNDFLYNVVKAFIEEEKELRKYAESKNNIWKENKKEFAEEIINIVNKIEGAPKDRDKINGIVNSEDVGYDKYLRERFMIKVISNTIADEEQKNLFLKNIDAILQIVEIQIRNKVKEYLDSNAENSEEENNANQGESSQDNSNDTNTNSGDDENRLSNSGDNNQKTSIFDQAFSKMKELGDDKYSIETTKEFNLIVSFNTPIEVLNKNNETIQLKNISFKPTLKFISDKICNLESEVVGSDGSEQVKTKKNIDLSKLKDKLPEKLNEDLEKMHNLASRSISEEEIDDSSEKSEESTVSSLPPPPEKVRDYENLSALLNDDYLEKFQKFDLFLNVGKFENFLNINLSDSDVGDVDSIKKYADSFLNENDALNNEVVEKFYPINPGTLDEICKKVVKKFEKVIEFDKAFVVSKKNKTFSFDENKMKLYAAALVCIYASVVFEENDKSELSSELIRYVEDEYKEKLEATQESPETESGDANSDESKEVEEDDLDINIDEDVMDEFIPFLESLDDTQVTVSLSELEDIKKKIEEKYSDKLDDDNFKKITKKLDEVIELEKERKSKVKNVTELTDPEVRNRKNAIRSTFSVLENIVKEKVDSKAKSEREKVLKDAEGRALKNEDELLVTGMTVGATLALGLGLVALPVLGGGAGVLALAAGIAGMSPAGLAGAALSKKFGSKVQIPTIEELEDKGLADKLYTNETDKYTKILEKCIDVLIRKALRESKFIYKRGLQFLLEDSKEELDAAELRKSKIKDSESLQISKKDIENAFVGEGFDFFRKNKKHIPKEEYEEFLSDFACILSYYHHVNVVDVITKKRTPEILTLRSRKNEITTAANQLLNFMDSANGQKVIEKIAKELDATEEETQKLVETLEQVESVVNKPEESKDSASGGDDDDKDDEPSEKESESDEDTQAEDENDETNDSEASKDEQTNSDSSEDDEEEISGDAFEDNENEEVTLFSNRQEIANELFKITKKIINSNNNEIGKIFKADNENRAIVIYRQKSNDQFGGPIKIAIIDPRISKKQTRIKSISAVENGYAVGFYDGQNTDKDSKEYIEGILNTLCSFTDSKILNDSIKARYFRDCFISRGINLSDTEVSKLDFDNKVSITSLKSEIDFNPKNESFVRSDLDLISERVVNSRFYKDKLSNLLFEEKEYNHSSVSFKSSRVNKSKSSAVRDLEKEMRRIWKI